MSGEHKPGCPCPLCAGKARTAAREAAEAEQAAMARASARLAVWMAAQFARQGSGGSAPDVLRQALGPEDALRVLRVAGYGTEQVRGSWAASVPVRRQATVQLGDWGPDHDPRVLQALEQRVSDAELARIRRQVAEEYQVKAMQKAAREAEYYGRDVSAAIGVSTGPGGQPVQTSTVHAGVPELGTEA